MSGPARLSLTHPSLSREIKAFALEQLFNAEASWIKCKVVGGIEGQANALAPRIKMPLAMFK